MTSNSEKLRSLFLSALMVFSVFAVTVTMSGGAAAALNNGESFDTSGNIADNNDQPEGETPLVSDGTLYAGQDVFVGGLAANNDYQVRTVTENNDNPNEIGDLRRTVEANASGLAQFTLDGRLAEGNFVLTDGTGNTVNIDSNGEAQASGPTRGQNSDGDATPTDSFEVVTQDLTAEFGDDTADAADDGDTVEFDISSDVRNGYTVNVSADSLDYDDLQSILDNSGTNDPGTDGNVSQFEDEEVAQLTAEQFDEFDANFSGIDEGTYTFEVNVTDSSANDSATIEVGDTGDDTATLNESLIEGTQGEVVEIPIQMENSDTATLEIGDFTDDNYNMTVEVEDDNSDGVVVVEFNTYSAGAVDAAGSPVSSYDITDNELIGGVVDVKSDDDAILSARENGSFSENRGLATAGTRYGSFGPGGVTAPSDDPVGANILDASEYDIRVEAGEHPYVSDDDDVATLDLSERSDDGVVVWTMPDDKVDDFSGEDNDERTEILYNYVNNGNITQTETVSIDDVTDAAVVQVQSSGLEGVFDYHLSDAGGGLSDRDAVYDTISSQGATNAFTGGPSNAGPGGDFVRPFSLSIDDDDATANTEDSGNTLGDSTVANLGGSTNQLAASDDDYTVIVDEDNGTHFVVLDDLDDSGSLQADDGDTFAANFSLSNSDGDSLTDGSIENTSEFSTVDADGEVNNGADVTVTANEGQTLDAETNVAPGTEVVIRARSTSQTAGSPFLKQPTGVVQPDGTVEATGDFSDAEAGTNFTAQIRVGGSNVGDEVDGTVLNATAETPTEGTEEPETETEAPETEAPETEEPTEMETEMQTEEPTEETTTGGSGPGFTAAIALIALIAAALLAVRRDN